MDSIRENESLQDMVDTLRLELSQDISHKLRVVIVEGDDDVSFVKNVFEPNVCVYESISGKQDVKNLIESMELQDERIIGIRDVDYADRTTMPDRLFCYDNCCLEVMLFSNDAVFQQIFHTYYQGTTDVEDLLGRVLQELSPLSILRRENERNQWNIDLRRAHIGDCVDTDHETLDHEKVFHKLSQTYMTLDDCKIQGNALNEDQLMDITNGHDMCRFMGAILQDKKGSLGEDRTFRLLLCNYRKEDFQTTRLYDEVRSYQQSCGMQNAKFVE